MDKQKEVAELKRGLEERPKNAKIVDSALTIASAKIHITGELVFDR